MPFFFNLSAPFQAFALFTTAAAVSFAACWRLLPVLRRRALLDMPNWRSSHQAPTPYGGGWAILIAILLGWSLTTPFLPSAGAAAAALVGAVLVAAVSWLDDVKNLGAAPRLATHALAVALGLLALPGDTLVFHGALPLWADRAAAGLGWLWFVNLFNFMDGIDGLAGSEAVSVCLCIALALWTSETGLPLTAAIVAGAACGFLPWNWQRAKMFMGDVGSVTLGYLCGWLLIRLAAETSVLVALIPPLYFLADATTTLLRRLARGEAVWKAHREHFYQQAVVRGREHAEVVRATLFVNAALAALTLAALRWPWISAAAAALLVAALMTWMARSAPKRPLEA